MTDHYPSFAQQPLPDVLPKEQPDLPAIYLRQQAALAFSAHRSPADPAGPGNYLSRLKAQIVQISGVKINHQLPLDLLERGKVDAGDFSIRNIRFQTQPGIYATASLYIPAGKGPFPAVVVTHGHWPDARRSELFQTVSQVLVRSGYVCLTIDAWGTGERSTEQGIAEYHGSNLGASLLNVGETLLGMQLTDNIRAVDLLTSLPYVDATKIGATGASGGGNQSMWLAAMDDRIKAVVPVVSVGTFEAYIMNSNCVCELLPGGLTFTEEAGILALIAPRPVKMLNALHDANPSFVPKQMIRSYQAALPAFQEQKAGDKISYQLFDSGHGYEKEMREAMLGWFNLHLKGAGSDTPSPEPAVKLYDPEKLATYSPGTREKEVISTASYCQNLGDSLERTLLKQHTLESGEKKRTLKALLKLEDAGIKQVHAYGQTDGWQRFAIETTNGSFLPVLKRPPSGSKKDWVVLIHGSGKDHLPLSHIQELTEQGYGLLIADLWGTGEQRSAEGDKIDGQLPPMHTLARSLLWLGQTVMGRWVSELDILIRQCKDQDHASSIRIDAYREAGVASLFYTALTDQVSSLQIFDSPYSYQFDDRAGIDYYHMGIHVPGILQWGDIDLLAALSTAKISFYQPRSISGKTPDTAKMRKLQHDFALLENRLHKHMGTTFINTINHQ